MNVVIREPDVDGAERYLLFGEYAAENLFHIEKSSVYKSVGTNFSTIEFILHHRNDILMVEAKSSSPKPGNKENFDNFIDEVYKKFTHSMELFFSLVLKRSNDPNDDMPKYFKSADYSTIIINMVLVINGHKMEWLAPIADALREKLKRHIKVWKLGMIVINHEQAKDYGLLKTTEEADSKRNY